MIILKRISLVFLISVFFTFCNTISYPFMAIYDWEGKSLPEKGIIEIYKKGTNFEKLLTKEKVDGFDYPTYEYKEADEIYLYAPRRNRFTTDNHYRIILDDSIVFEISEIITKKDIKDIKDIYRIESMKVNNEIISGSRRF